MKVVKGIYKQNNIITEQGKNISCVTYGSISTEITGKLAYLHLATIDGYKNVIYQYVLIDEDVSEE